MALPSDPGELKLRGSWRAKSAQKASQTAPTISPGVPERPKWIESDPEAWACWKRMTAALSDAGLLCEADGNLLARYCWTWSRWLEAEDTLDAEGVSYTTKTHRGHGEIARVNPAMTLSLELSKLLLTMELQLAATPLARKRLGVRVGSPDAEDERRFVKIAHPASKPAKGDNRGA